MRTAAFEMRDISIHAPRKGERPQLLLRRGRDCGISIHAPRKGERRTARQIRLTGDVISIHAPRKGERRLRPWTTPRIRLFQSTLPARGSDHARFIYQKIKLYFNPRSPQGGATPWRPVPRAPQRFQSTLPARGSDGVALSTVSMLGVFQSTLPARGSDVILLAPDSEIEKISIHAPRKGERPRAQGCTP